MTTAYRTRPTRSRRSPDEIDAIRGALFATLEADHPMTVRQVFYRLVTQRVIEKTEAEYKHTVTRLLTELRLSRQIPFGWIADNTRWMRKPPSYSSLDHAIQQTASTYRRALWETQNAYVEVWLEKDALAGVLYDVTEPWDVPLMVTRGYASLSYLHGAAEVIAEVDKPAYLYYFGDYDPSGLDITRNVEARLREFAPEAEIYFERVAVTPEQITSWNLPTRPTKTADSRSQHFEGQSVEVDAIPVDHLRAIVTACITQHVDQHALAVTHAIEDEERKTLHYFARRHLRQRRPLADQSHQR